MNEETMACAKKISEVIDKEGRGTAVSAMLVLLKIALVESDPKTRKKLNACIKTILDMR